MECRTGEANPSAAGGLGHRHAPRHELRYSLVTESVTSSLPLATCGTNGDDFVECSLIDSRQSGHGLAG